MAPGQGAVVAAVAAAVGAAAVFMISLFNIKDLGGTLGSDHGTLHCTLKIYTGLPFTNLSLEPCHFGGLQDSSCTGHLHGHQITVFHTFCSPHPAQDNGSFL